jgi:hypothetical protein
MQQTKNNHWRKKVSPDQLETEKLNNNRKTKTDKTMKTKITLSYGFQSMGSTDKKYRIIKITGDILIFAKGKECHVDDRLDEEQARSLINFKDYEVTVIPIK